MFARRSQRDQGELVEHAPEQSTVLLVDGPLQGIDESVLGRAEVVLEVLARKLSMRQRRGGEGGGRGVNTMAIGKAIRQCARAQMLIIGLADLPRALSEATRLPWPDVSETRNEQTQRTCAHCENK